MWDGKGGLVLSSDFSSWLLTAYTVRFGWNFLAVYAGWFDLNNNFWLVRMSCIKVYKL